MRIRGGYRARKLLRRVGALFQSRIVVLMYHRVAEPATDAQLLSVTPQRFAGQMEHLRRHYPVLSVQELSQRWKSGRFPRRAVVVTFDDGYMDNLQVAAPILDQLGIPAIVFITTGALATGMVFWWDELENLLLRSPKLPLELCVRIETAVYRWNLGTAASISTQESLVYRTWNVDERGDPTPRHRAYRELHRLLRPLAAPRREEVFQQLRVQAGSTAAGTQAPRGMTSEEVRALAGYRLMEVGAHTVTHPQLAALPTDMQQHELNESKRSLETLLGRAVTAVAYPYGDPASVSEQTVTAAREAAYELAFTTVAAPLTRFSDRYRVPRFTVRNWTPEEFGERLRAWFRE